MYNFSKRSKKILKTCHPDLQLICNHSIKIYDFSIIGGYRSLETQKNLFAKGKSKLNGINRRSKHQDTPSIAVDIAPYPIDWQNLKRFYYLGGLMVAIANNLQKQGKLRHRLRWGGDWDRDGKFNDQIFNDLTHFELVMCSHV